MLRLGDIDPSTFVRHFVPEDRQHRLAANQIHKLQSRLRELGFEYMVGNIDGCFNLKLKTAVMAFQSQAEQPRRTRVDLSSGRRSIEVATTVWAGVQTGDLDASTALELNAWLVAGYRNSARAPLSRIGHTWVRPELFEALSALSARLTALGTRLPEEMFSGFRHPANIDRSEGMAQKSLHHTGCAIDLDEWRGMQSLQDDYFFVTRSSEGTFWRIYIRSASSEVPWREIQPILYNRETSSYHSAMTAGRFLDLTHEFIGCGLAPIQPLSGWENSYYRSEWWHFELADADNNWHERMNEIGYSAEMLKVFGY